MGILRLILAWFDKKFGFKAPTDPLLNKGTSNVPIPVGHHIYGWKMGLVIAFLVVAMSYPLTWVLTRFILGLSSGMAPIICSAAIGILWFVWTFLNVPMKHKAALIEHGERVRIGPTPVLDPTTGDIPRDKKGRLIVPHTYGGLREGWYSSLVGYPFREWYILDSREQEIPLVKVEGLSKDRVLTFFDSVALFNPQDAYDIQRVVADGGLLTGLPAAKKIYTEIAKTAQRLVIAEFGWEELREKKKRPKFEGLVAKEIEKDITKKEVRLGGTSGLLTINSIRFKPEFEAAMEKLEQEKLEAISQATETATVTTTAGKFIEGGVNPNVATAAALALAGHKDTVKATAEAKSYSLDVGGISVDPDTTRGIIGAMTTVAEAAKSWAEKDKTSSPKGGGKKKGGRGRAP